MRASRFVIIWCACAALTGCGPSSKVSAPGAMQPAARGIPGQELLTAPIVLLGETHGTTEIPTAFGELVLSTAALRGGTILVGLEIYNSLQAAIDTFMASNGSAQSRGALLTHEFWQRDYQDGRSSTAMVGLLETLRRGRASGLNLSVVAIDAAQPASASARDASMAAAVNKAIEAQRPGQTLILVGDVHSRLLKGYPWNPGEEYMSVGALLRARHVNVEGLRTITGGGTAWMCQSAVAAECGSRSLRVREVTGAIPRIELQPDALDEVGWSGALYLGSLTASVPARQPGN